jgi:transposase
MSALAPSGPEPGKPGAGESAVDIDRRNPVLGNPFVLHDHRDATARAEVMELYRAQLEDDLRNDSQMAAATEALAARPRGRAPRSHVLVLAKTVSRQSEHFRDQPPAQERA